MKPVFVGRKKFCVDVMGPVRSVVGLMFDQIDRKDGALIHGNSIWMPFVRKPLWLLFLSDDMKVIKLEKAVPMTWKPSTWRIYSCRDAKYCLELAKDPGKAEGKAVRIGSSPCSR